ncbi:hypothetical protein [Mycolicibacterium goodii]|uniref:hypothetical protein n=1 Tax=Mycolicibacterium goodii TaxID=134601 RepID=UPI00256F352B|nr:hypothetical protein [Mycolicibacterium goodii]
MCDHRWRIERIEPPVATKPQPRTIHLTCRDCDATQDMRTLRTDAELALERWLSAEDDWREGAA